MVLLPVIYVDQLAVCIKSVICNILKLSKSLLSSVKCDEAPESKIQNRVTTVGFCFPL